MATFLDVTRLEYFNPIFVFIFVWIVVYATLIWSKVLGSNNILNAMIGLILGIFVVTSNAAILLVSKVAPFLTVVFVLIMLFNVAGGMLGGRIESFPAMKGIFLSMIIFIVLVGIALEIRGTFGEAGASTEPQSDLSKNVNLLLHPTFLGMILILTVSVFTIALLAAKG
ncbi:hypothetical protein HYS31_03560 [Candidatus Woesearchaeota archaeon]|nr:hypothetical protein [Candidatus Woesearchaeota archaeon]